MIGVHVTEAKETGLIVKGYAVGVLIIGSLIAVGHFVGAVCRGYFLSGTAYGQVNFVNAISSRFFS